MRVRPFLLGAIALAIGACALLSSAALAHRMRQTITSVELNTRTRSVEIVVQLHLEDVETALALQGKRFADPVGQPEGQAAIRAMLESSLKLTIGARPARLEFVGLQQEGFDIYALFEARPRKGAVLLENNLFLDVFPDQVNMVNVRVPGSLQTYVYQGQGS